MLTEAQDLRRNGVDVVLGYVESHRRAETQALVEGLEQVPLLELEHRGAVLSEVDVEAVIARRPALVLIDELAHTNAPGSRHAKRWQDVQDVLDAGIDVFTALNIQHLESLNDVVAQVTGVRVSETVPDSFLDRADEITVIDLPPAELRKRLQEGKVYLPERVDHALEGFFKTSNLTALRELALRKAADTIDAEVQRLKTKEGATGPWATRERIVVCIAPNRMASRVLRAAARLGSSSHAELIAVYVESDRQVGRTDEEHEAVQGAFELASQLGLEVATLSGHDIVAEVMAFAQRRNATLIIVGKPIRPRWREILFGSVVDELVRASGDIDVHVITADREPQVARRAPRRSDSAVTPTGVSIVVAAAALSTGVGLLLIQGFGLANVAMIYLLGVALGATRVSRIESMAGALLSVLCFNFFFVEPRYTFAVHDARYLLLFVVMLIVALVISSLTHQLRGQLQATAERERRTQSLYTLSRQLTAQRGKRELAAAAAKEIRGVFQGDVAVFLSEGASLSLIERSETGFESESNEVAVATWVAEHGVQAGRDTDTLPGASALYLPLATAEATIGVLAFRPERELPKLAQRQLLETFANALGLALERAVLAKASNDARVQAESERIRSALLSSISHDLRTPLTSITGAASSILAGSPNSHELAGTIVEESVRLNQQIQNLLDMTRLQGEEVKLNREWHAPGDLVASALRQIAPSLGSRRVDVDLQPMLELLWVDGLLVEKALVNLLENAARYSGATAAVRIAVTRRTKDLVFTVSDSGPGLPGDPSQVFRLGREGLGLAIVQAIVDLHGGRASARNVPGSGAEFQIALPLPDSQPEAPVG